MIIFLFYPNIFGNFNIEAKKTNNSKQKLFVIVVLSDS